MVAPPEWREVRLGDLGPFTKGQGIRKREVVEAGLPCIRYGQIYTDHHDWIREFTAFIPPAVAHTSRRLLPGELLFTGSGETADEIGKCVAFLDDEEAYAGGDIVILTPEGVVSKYLGYRLNAADIVRQRMRLAQGDAVVHISASRLASLRLSLPPLTEQQAIAEALSDADSAIQALDAAISKKCNLRTGVAQELLSGRTRLSGFSEEWSQSALGDLLSYEQPTKYLVSSSDYSEGGPTPVLTAGKTFILGYTSETSGVFDWGPTILFDDFTTASRWVDFGFKVKSSACKMLTLKSSNASLRYVFEQIQRIRFKPSDHKRHWISTFAAMSIPRPVLDEQSAIAQVLSDMDVEIESLISEREKLCLMKEGMMQELLSGRVRLV